MKPIFLITILAFVGCSASMDSRLNKQSAYAPVNEINGGAVSYLNQGYQFAIDSRRKDAYKKMHDSCNGPYKIVQENETSGDTTAFPIGGMIYAGQEHRIVIRFECVPQGGV